MAKKEAEEAEEQTQISIEDNTPIEFSEPLTLEMAEARLIESMGDLVTILIIAIIADVILAIIGVDIGITDAISDIFGWVVFLILGLSSLRLIRRELDKKDA